MSDKRQTILIVDDMATNIEALAAILNDKYTILAALNGKRALEIAKQKSPELILLDVEMPDEDGYETCEALKSEPSCRDIPIIFVTAKNEAEDEERGFALGAVDYVAKPFMPSTILSRVGAHIKLREQEIALNEFNKTLSIKVEEELAARNLSEKRYKTLFESSPIPIFINQITDMRFGALKDVNEAALRLTGYEREELVRLDYSALYGASASKFYDNPLQPSAPLRFETECIKKDGRTVPVLVYSEVFDIEGTQMAYSYWMDLSHIKKIEAEKLAKDKLLIQQSKLATMGEMIGAIGHQWRQPLSSLSLLAQDVEYAFMYDELDEAYVKEFKRKAMETIRYMSKTIDDFRNFFSPNKKEESFFIEDAIGQTLSILQAQFKNNDISLVFNNEEGQRHEYFCNKNELSQVILNILANAKDAIFERRPKNPFIKIEVCKDDKWLYISVEDSAGGVKEEYISRIFDSYFTTKEQSGGTGIGLYMSKSIVEEHLGGSITVENTDNGAKFTIRLPLTQDI